MEPQTNELKAIKILYLALLAGQSVFALIVTALVETGVINNKDHTLVPVFQVAITIVAAAAIPASFFLFRRRLSAIDPEDSLENKFGKYRAGLIVRLALCQAPTMFAIIVYFVTQDHFFLWIIILLIANFVYIYPSKNKIIDQLQLNSSEQSSLGMDRF